MSKREKLVGVDKKVEELKKENRILRHDAERERADALEKVGVREAELEALRTTHKGVSRKYQMMENSVKELKKELHRSKTQLEGVQEQSASVQVNLKRFYEAEILGLREELESLGVHVGGEVARGR